MLESLRNILGGSTSGSHTSGHRGGGCGGCGLVVILVGLGMIVASVPVLLWNEGRAVSTYRTLIEGAAIVKSIRADAVDAATDGQLVHLVGMATTTETLHDTELGVSAPAIKLYRKVEMYQWDETEHDDSNDSNSSSHTYTYSKKWSESLINSGSFHDRYGHENPDTMPYASTTWTAEAVSLGAYTLSASLVDQMKNFQALAVEKIPSGIDRKILLSGNGFYMGNNPASPSIGDLRIAYTQVTPTTVSVIAQAAGRTFEPFRGKAGDTINMLTVGEHSAPEMFETAQQDNVIITWFLRVAGAFMMVLGFQALNQPISGLLRLLPIFGREVQKGFGCLVAVAAALIAIPLSTVIIVAGWIFFHLT